MFELPKYQCHKKVWALKITAIEFNEDGSAKFNSAEGMILLDVENYRSKFKGDENDLGYYVIYNDGYSSWSPTKAFEEGYTKL